MERGEEGRGREVGGTYERREITYICIYQSHVYIYIHICVNVMMKSIILHINLKR